jgi:hypothetical protein
MEEVQRHLLEGGKRLGGSNPLPQAQSVDSGNDIDA